VSRRGTESVQEHEYPKERFKIKIGQGSRTQRNRPSTIFKEEVREGGKEGSEMKGSRKNRGEGK